MAFCVKKLSKKINLLNVNKTVMQVYLSHIECNEETDELSFADELTAVNVVALIGPGRISITIL